MCPVGQRGEVRSAVDVEQSHPVAARGDEVGVGRAVTDAQGLGPVCRQRRQWTAMVGQGQLLLVAAAPDARRVELAYALVFSGRKPEHTGGDRSTFMFVGVKQSIAGAG